MAKQYLDYKGLQTLITGLKSLFLNKSDTTAIFNVNDTDINLNSNIPLNISGNGITFSINSETNTLELTSESGANYVIKQNELPEDSQYGAQYQLFKNNVAVPDSIINIPKDKYLSDIEIRDINNTSRSYLEDFPDDYPSGKYLVFTVADVNTYINIDELSRNFTAGNGIDITDEVISVKTNQFGAIVTDETGLSVNIESGNGLVLSNNSIKMNEATELKAGALSTIDKKKLIALENSGGIEYDKENNQFVIKVEESNGLTTDDISGIMLSLATKNSAGAMSSNDKIKLDELEETEAIPISDINRLFNPNTEVEDLDDGDVDDEF